MKLAIALLASALATSDAANRKLSFEKVAGYEPGSQVTDHCAIDLDQKAMESQLALKTDASFQNARRIYEEGAFSKSYAQITLTSPGLATSIAKGAAIMGKNAAGNEVAGKAYTSYAAGDLVLKVQYQTGDVQSSYVECQVGGLLVENSNTDGCLIANGDITVDGKAYAYTYVVETDNDNGRTIAGFSTGAGPKMRTDCKGCPYDDFSYFYNYYGTDDYAHEWVTAAFESRQTAFSRGKADFSRYDFAGREQVIKKGTAYMNVFMYVMREFEDALDDCESNCMDCNEGSVHAWDEGVCFYAGSIEGQSGASGGKLLHELGDKRCTNFKTCGQSGTDSEGMAKVNHELMDLFDLGNYQIKTGECALARDTTTSILKKMYIPMIQGSIRYAYKVDKLGGGEKEAAEGAVFAAAVLPRVHAANADAAQTIYNNMRVGASGTKFAEVKSAFESVYPSLGLSCADIGGLWDEAAGAYYPGMEPCGGVGVASAEGSASSVAKAGMVSLAALSAIPLLL